MKSPEPIRSKPASGTRSIPRRQTSRRYACDRCGGWMVERQCKAVCPNCGCQFDCSDLTIHFDELDRGQVETIHAAAGGPDEGEG